MVYLELIQSLSIIVASLAALYGINAWRVELRGKKAYELAEEVLALFYEARDRLRGIRSPLGWAGEGQSRKSKPNETEREKKALDQAYVVFERFQKMKLCSIDCMPSDTDSWQCLDQIK